MSTSRITLSIVALVFFAAPRHAALGAENGKLNLVFACGPENDLYRVIGRSGSSYPRHGSAAEAIRSAPEGAGVLLLADGYPKTRTGMTAGLYETAAKKRVRLYVEYPSMVPGLSLGEPRFLETGTYGAILERTVVASDLFAPRLPKPSILMISSCHCLPVAVETPHLVLARVVGHDTAVLGLPKEVTPILFEIPSPPVMVATTKLSHFVTGRCAPTDAWDAVWETILGWLAPGQTIPDLQWTATVRPSYQATDTLPKDAPFRAVRRAAEWYRKSRLLVHQSGTHWTPGAGRGVKPLPPDWKVGDGTFGILECYISKRIFLDGGQAVNPSNRADCNLESSMGLAFGSVVLKDRFARDAATHLNDFIWFRCPVSQGPRADPASPSYGLLGHNAAPQSHGHYFSDDNARAVLGSIASAAMVKSDRWDEAILRTILGNFRTTGVNGFRPGTMLNEAELQAKGWQHYWNHVGTDFIPHYHAYIWCTYLWLYHKTGFKPLLERARTGIRLMMAAYPDRWHAECGRTEEERIHMLLPLAWLVRVDDRPEPRAWLRTMAEYVVKAQHTCGAIPQTVAKPYAANAQYGTGEAPIIYATGDPATDLLYTMNFALIGMHEAAAATGNPEYARCADRMAEFVIRVQTRSETHPELDGTWFRSFDFKRWEYWGSDGDAGWGVWTTETGWTHSWITATLALRHMETSLWDLTSGSKIARHMKKYRPMMLPDDVLQRTTPK